MPPTRTEREHKLRLIVIGSALAVILIAIVVLLLNGIDEGTGFGAVVGAFMVLAPALVDSSRVYDHQRMARDVRESARPPRRPREDDQDGPG